MKINLRYFKSLEFFLLFIDITLLLFLVAFYFIGVHFYNQNIQEERIKDQNFVLNSYYEEINNNLKFSIDFFKVIVETYEKDNQNIDTIKTLNLFNIIFNVDYSYSIEKVIYPTNYNHLKGFDISNSDIANFKSYKIIDNVYIFDSFTSFYSGKYSILLIYIFKNKIYAAELNLEKLFYSIEKTLNYKKYYFLIVSKPNNIILKRSKDFYLSFWNSEKNKDYILFKNKKYFFSEKEFDFLKIGIISFIDESSYDYYKIITNKFLFGLIFIFVLSIIFRIIIYNKYNMKPIKSLVKSIESDLTYKFECNSTFYEWQIVEKQFNNFIDKIEEYSNSLRKELDEKNKIFTEMQEYKNFLIEILNSLNSIIIIINKNQEVILFNQKAESLINVKNINNKNKKIFDLNNFFYLYLKNIEDSFLKKETVILPKELLIFNNSYKYFEINLIPFHNNDQDFMIIKMDDISDKIKMQEFLQNNENILTLSTITKSLSVNINNPLEAIMQSIQLIKKKFDPNILQNIETANELNIDIQTISKYLEKRNIPKNFDNIEIATEKILKIIQVLLDFGKTTKKEKKVVKIFDVINNSIKFLNDYAISKGNASINIIKELNNNIEIETYEYELTKAIFNILKNSYESILSKEYPDNIFPFIKIKTSIIEGEKKYYSIIIEDNGIGIKEENLNKIFSPFWTTKNTDEHLGLGLTNALMFIKEQINGNINIESTENVGTIATIILNLP